MRLVKILPSAFALMAISATAAAAFPATATTDLNVRSGPGTNFRVVGQLQAGQTVDVVSQSGSWSQLADGGWASANYLEGGGSAAIGPEYADPGYAVAFYYDDTPYYWDDAGYYWFWRAGVRHRINRDWWRRHRHDVRWDRRWRRRDWDGDRIRNVRRDIDERPGVERRIDRRVDRREFSNRGEGPQRRVEGLREGRASAGGPPPRRMGGGEFRGRGGGGGQPWIPQGGGGMRGGHMGGGHMGGGGGRFR